MISSAPPSYATTRSKTLGSRLLSSCKSSFRMGITRSLYEMLPAESPARPSSQCHCAGAPLFRGRVCSACERVLGGPRTADDCVDRWLLLERPLDRFLRRAVVVVENFLVIGGIPMDEHTDSYAVVVDLVPWDDAARDGVDDRTSHRGLRGTEHLHGLLRALDRDLVVEDRVGLRWQVGCHDGEQGRETILVVRQCFGERVSHRALF